MRQRLRGRSFAVARIGQHPSAQGGRALAAGARWTTLRPITLRPTALAFRALERRRAGRVVPQLPRRLVSASRDAATTRDAALAGVTVEPLDDAALVQIRGEIQGGNMDAVPLEKAPKIAVYAPPNAAAVGRRGHDGAQLRGNQVREDLGPGGAGAELKTYDWLHLHHEDFTGQYSKFFLNYAGRALAGGDGGAEPGDGPHAGLSIGAGREAAPWRMAIAKFVENGRVSCSRCAPPRRRWTWRSRADGVDIAASYADGRPMEPDATARMKWDRALAFQDARLELSPTTPVYSDIDGHQVNSPDRRQPLGSLHPVQLQRQDRSRRDDAGAEPPAGDPRLLRPDHFVHPEDAEAQRHRPGRGAGRPVGQVHPRRARPGHLDLLRRARPRGSAAPDRRRPDRSVAASALTGLSAHPEQRPLSRRRRRKS